MEDELIRMVKEAKTGNKEVLIKLIMSQKQDYYRLAYTYMKNQEDALDAMEDMILKVYENLKKLKDHASFYSWSKTILVNCCRDNLRRKNKVLLFRNVPEGSHEDVFHRIEEQMDIEEHWEKLNQKYQEVLKLRYYLDMDYESIAKLLKIPLGTVKSRIHTGLFKLKQSMGVSKG
ncbi:RNA polymerase sigma factor, sigma-70 family [Desulfosporosinus orientis DSM 765]|uniref:RNA polymerase sigma factor, sigma-70 family n=1 Tax=Desulfosporosinus orientis (strain ATCC 19365 / DSM 765 / NCIMB 8382 / VKM B-1628 / Singapore I) TaxID=768706 RepID=G7WCH4_DESOD|nr:sigma-70 family RNA polymerase sigma factor [Desulfosporosinus orientis]AET66296.1 RNA polymerase sigma factor, sigma-70 family [Desulfosporosinus orientis DSM 765]